jgi:hypothetical protein
MKTTSESSVNKILFASQVQSRSSNLEGFMAIKHGLPTTSFQKRNIHGTDYVCP